MVDFLERVILMLACILLLVMTVAIVGWAGVALLRTFQVSESAPTVADAGSSSTENSSTAMKFSPAPVQDDESVTSSEGLHGPVYWKLSGADGLLVNCGLVREALQKCVSPSDYVSFGYWRPSACKTTCEEVSTKSVARFVGWSVPLTLCSEDKKTGKQTCYRNGKQVPSMPDLLPEN